MSSWNGRGYKPGTIVQHRTGYIFVKTIEGMVAQARLAWENKFGGLQDGDRVFHRDGDRENNDPSNLAAIHFNQTKYRLLPEGRILWEPKR